MIELFDKEQFEKTQQKNKFVVAHKDGNIRNCKVNNLLVTPKGEMNKRAIKEKLKQKEKELSLKSKEEKHQDPYFITVCSKTGLHFLFCPIGGSINKIATHHDFVRLNTLGNRSISMSEQDLITEGLRITKSKVIQMPTI